MHAANSLLPCMHGCASHTHTHTHTQIHTYMHTHIHTYIHALTHTYTYAHPHAYTPTHTHIHTHSLHMIPYVYILDSTITILIQLLAAYSVLLCNSCWIDSTGALVGGFLVPLAIAACINVTLFYRIACSLHRAAQQRRSAGNTGLKQQTHQRELRAVLSISLLMGMAWLFAALINTNERNSSLVFQYLFAIFVSLQGFAIFLMQCVFSEAVREALSSTKISRPSWLHSKSTTGEKKPVDSIPATGSFKYSRQLSSDRVNAALAGAGGAGASAAAGGSSADASTSLSLPAMSMSYSESHSTADTSSGHALSSITGHSISLGTELTSTSATSPTSQRREIEEESPYLTIAMPD